MSGSNPGDGSDDPGEHSDRDRGRDRDRDPQERANAGDRPPAEGSGPTESSGSADASSNPADVSSSPVETGAKSNPNPDRVTIGDDGVVHWFLHSEDGNVVFARDMVSSIAIVAVIGLILFGVSGVWPPLVAVESGSMEPNMERGDLIFVVDDDRFVGDDPADGTGVVPLENGQASDHEKFGTAGDVIVFRPNGDDRRTPIIHRAHFWVDEGEDWVETKADDDIIGDTTCADLVTCPAPHAGFITKGDANANYDQQGPGNRIQSDVVRAEWVTGKAMFRVPWLGHVRLTFDELLADTTAPSPVLDTTPVPIDSIDEPAAQAGLAGATGFAAAGGGLAAAIGRRRR